MKHILYLLIFLFQSCCAMNYQQNQEEAFRTGLKCYLSLHDITTPNTLSEEAKRQYCNVVRFGSYNDISGLLFSFERRFGVRITPPSSIQDVQQRVEEIAGSHGILNHLQSVVRFVIDCANTNQALILRILQEEIHRILSQEWIDLTKLQNDKAQGSSFDMIGAGLERAQKDKDKGKQFVYDMHKPALLCHLLMAYGGAPNAVFMIYTTLPHYTIVD